MPLDLWADKHFQNKQRKRLAKMKADEFEPADEAIERYVAERIEPTLETYRQSDHDWFKSWSRRKGEMLHSSDLIHAMQKLNPYIFVQAQVNFPSDWGIYTSALGRIQFLTGMPRGWLTEFSYSICDDRDLPTEERRGWRTVLVYTLMKGALTWEQVLAEFGEPTDGFNDYRWQEITADFRHGGDQTVQRNIANLLEH